MNIKLDFKIGVSLLSVFLLSVNANAKAQNVRVVWSSAPQTEAVVVWDAEALSESASLVYDTISHKEGKRDYAFSSALSESGLYKESSAPKSKKGDRGSAKSSPKLFYHHAPLKQLKPGTIYYLAVKDAEGTGREYHFKTAPADGTPIKLIFAGDSRTRMDVARGISTQISKMIAKDDSIVALLHGGDYAGAPRRDMWKEWLEAYALTTTADGKLLPIIPVVGNHEKPSKNPLFRQAYGYPGGKDDYYLCRLTPSVAVLVLNTETSTDGVQRKFLQTSLEMLKKEKIKWQIAAYHKPAFPAIKQASSAKVSWVPLFEQYNLDLALESDGHCIKRTVPIRNGKEAADGVVYLGEGGYGAPQRDFKPDRWYIQGEHAFISKGDHMMMLEITPQAINYSTILNAGKVVDSASFKSRR